jgi:hypothetical protein
MLAARVELRPRGHGVGQHRTRDGHVAVDEFPADGSRGYFPNGRGMTRHTSEVDCYHSGRSPDSARGTMSATGAAARRKRAISMAG